MQYRYRFRRNYRRRYRRRNKKSYYPKSSYRKDLVKPNTWVGRHLGQINPDRIFVKLPWVDQNFILNNAGLGFANNRYRINGAHDPDPASGSNGILGYPELALIYSEYRVHASKIELEVANNDDTFTVYIVPIAENQDPGSNGIGLINLVMAPYSRTRVLASKGGMDRAKLSTFITFNKLIGSKQVKYDNLYSANVSTNPINGIWCVIGAYASNNTITFTNGITGMLKITYYMEFYNRQQLTNPGDDGE